MIAAVSAQFGLEGYVITSEQCNWKEYCKIFSLIEQFGANYVAFVDNLSYHKSRYTLDYLMCWKIEQIFKIAQALLLNPIEAVFSVVESSYRRFNFTKHQNSSGPTP